MESRGYEPTVAGVMGWASAEMYHIGEISTMASKNHQYAYAQSTANGLAHLHDALREIIADPRYRKDRPDLIKTHNTVVRAIRGLVKQYRIDIDEIRRFNTRHILSDLSYATRTRGTRKTKKNQGK